MPSDDIADVITSSSYTLTGSTVTDRVTYRVGTLTSPLVKRSVGSIHAVAPIPPESGGGGGEFIPGCICCQATIACRQNICDQCPDGYAPYFFTWFLDGGVRLFGSTYLYPNGITFANGVSFGGFASSGGAYVTSAFQAIGDCQWEATLQRYSAPEAESGIYFKLYYSSGWKLYVDYFRMSDGFTIYPYLGPSGNELIFSLDSFTCCPPVITGDMSSGPSGGSTSTLTLVSGSPLSLDDPLTITFGSCGCGLVTVPCSASKVPRFLSISLPGATVPPDGTVAGLGYVSSSFWSGQGYARAGLGSYRFVLACISGTWNLKIYLSVTGSPDVLKYNQNATTSTDYPIYASFPQSGFDFDGIFSGQTFTIDVTI